MVLQLDDQTIKKPYDIIEDMLVKVDKFIFPTDFVILDFYVNCPLILGRPFMNIGGALVDVSEGKIILRIGDDKIEFDMNRAMKYPMDEIFCMELDLISEEHVIRPLIEEETEETNPEPLLREDGPIPPSIEIPPAVDMKDLPDHMRYAFLADEGCLPIIIISNKLNRDQEEKLLHVVRKG
ncbi:hypothetical protein M5689_013137 [Euphorbia peplus]|nr:hypothetical protein M5689_013137 [Euphorbia peplus]